jgi:hypothetical protein
MSSRLRRVVSILVLVLVVLAVVRAAAERFREQEAAFLKECQQQRQQMGLTPEQAKAKYPSPEIGLVAPSCIPAGSTGDVVVNGRFAAGSRFFVEDDAIEVLNGSQTATQYRATLKAPADLGPMRAGIAVISPVSGITSRKYDAISVGGKFEWTLQVSNGWKVTARPQGDSACPGAAAGGDRWQMNFHRAGEGVPFEKPTAQLSFSRGTVPSYGFAISESGTGMEDYQALMLKMSDPKLPDAERQRVMEQLEAMASKMSDPNYMKQMVAQQQQRQQEFGCQNIELRAAGGGTFTGTMRCSEKVGRRLDVKATLTLAK